jgi:hypothetical protein
VRQPVIPILKGVKPGKMLTNYLFRPITFDPFGTRVPVGDDASDLA